MIVTETDFSWRIFLSCKYLSIHLFRKLSSSPSFSKAHQAVSYTFVCILSHRSNVYVIILFILTMLFFWWHPPNDAKKKHILMSNTSLSFAFWLEYNMSCNTSSSIIFCGWAIQNVSSSVRDWPCLKISMAREYLFRKGRTGRQVRSDCQKSQHLAKQSRSHWW